MDRTTIPTAHLQAGVPISTDSPGVSHVMRGLVRKAVGKGQAPKQVQRTHGRIHVWPDPLKRDQVQC